MKRMIGAVLCVGIALGGIVSQAGAQEAKERFRIGGLLALSGPLGILGEDARKGMDLAIAERDGKLLGVPIDIEWADTESKPQVAVQKATQAMAGGAEFLVGSVGSGETLAIMKVSGAREVPLLVPLSTDPSITAANRNAFTFRTASSGETLAIVAAEYLKDLAPKKIYGVASDYGVARAGWDVVKNKLAGGSEFVGEDFPALGEKDYTVIINKILSSGADAAYIGLGGSDCIAFIKQAGEVGLLKTVRIVGPNLVDTTIAAGAGDASIGVASVIRYDVGLPADANKKFVEAFKAKYGQLPSQLAGDSYDGFKWWLEVVDATKSWDKNVWMKAFGAAKWDGSVLGHREMRACDSQSQHPSYVAEVVKGEGETPYAMKIVAEFAADRIATACP
ncbi:MAG: ABC transporter substrate-binding protein [Mesorhizobium sp.]|nr:ABC transporter substrate-binding protein [Mesorhizobium sp.]